jgi:hypothetical protein
MPRRLTAATFVLILALCACAPASAKTFEGKLEVVHADDFAHGRGETNWTLRTGHRRIPIRPTAVPRAGSGDKVAVRGRKSGRWLEGKVIRRGGPRVKAASALGNHKVAVILINFAGDASEPWTPAQVRDRIFDDPASSTAAFYNEESGGDVTVTGDVFGWYTISASNNSCDVDTWAQQAQAAVGPSTLAAYDNVMYVFPDQSSCNWAGLGELPGRQTWLNGDISVRVAAHELGHNLGLHHASSYSCTSNGVAVTWSTNCTASEYGDPFDVMGINAYHNNAWHLAQLGVLHSANRKTITGSGTYTIRSAADSGTGTMLLRIPTGGSPARWYDLSIRANSGYFDSFLSNSAILNGVSIHWDRDTPYLQQSLLLDATPTSGGWINSTLTQGATFSDGSTSITADSVSPGSATVSVVLGAQTDVEPPTAPGAFAAAGVQGGADLSWSAATDNTGVTGYRVLRDGAIVATTPGLTYADRNLVPGSTHGYRVQAVDAAGNGSAQSVLRWVTVPAAPPNPGPGAGDVTAPVVDVLSPRRRARLRGRALISARASDNSSVARMDLYIDGRRVAAIRGATLRRTWTLRHVRAGAHTLRVRATDASGNHASRSIAVRVLRGS